MNGPTAAHCIMSAIYLAKEPYLYGKRALFIWQKSPIYMAKGPIYMAKEPYLYGKRALFI